MLFFRYASMKWLACIIIYTFGTACNPDLQKENTGSLTIQFNSKYGSQSFQTLQAYPYSGKQMIKFNAFDFYITGLQLFSPTGNLPVDQVGLVDLTSGTKDFKLTDIKSGNYTGLQFNIGVKSDLNKKLPKDFKSTNPLSSTSHYWDSWNSYIFSRMEGVLDTAGNNSFELPFAIHTGTDVCLQTVTIQKIMDIPVGSDLTLVLDLDIQNVFSQSGVYFDLVNSPLNHNPTNIEVLKLFSTRLAQAIQQKK